MFCVILDKPLVPTEIFMFTQCNIRLGLNFRIRWHSLSQKNGKLVSVTAVKIAVLAAMASGVAPALPAVFQENLIRTSACLYVMHCVLSHL